MLRTIACALDRAAQRAPRAPALLVPEQGVALTYGELSRATRAFALGLRAWGVRPADVVAVDLPNTSECLLLQLAASRVGAAVATVKGPEELSKLASSVAATGGRLSATIAATPDSFLAGAGAALPLGSVTAGRALDELIRGQPDGEAAEPSAPADARADVALAYWAALTPLTQADALAQGSAFAAGLALRPDDRVCVAVTLCHAFGIASACTGAMLSGAAIVLPAVGGIRGCGVPEERAAVTLRVLAAQRCSVLVADTHTLKALGSPALVRAREPLDLSALRTGACKVGSGADFLDADVEFAGVPLRTVGKRAPPAGGPAAEAPPTPPSPLHPA
ncbi:hypothetical protein KFE25_008142 [Diacronema lutheri]|uniref:AMP-dependent synthetase/ligase domain-containing protein n=2 Tax=Diacronema lutheri TaxID=2081491 RepID=A0A8J6CGJ1_DIALT|nr:hypothetical protein KFE25_008142 [Diacronema lutheri]